MADSWEDEADEPPPSAPAAKTSFSFNPNAATFSFNPGASSFTPTFTPSAPTPPAAAAPAPVAATPAPPATVESVPVPAASGEPAPEATEADQQADQQEVPEDDTDVAEVSEVTAGVKEMTVKEKKKDAPLEELEDNREHLNLVFIGHVDAGKSTIGGQILYSTGMVDERTVQKYEREAKDKNRDSWYMAYIMDTNEEERAKGKTVECGRAYFETEKKRYTILDAPGHKNYVPNMIHGTAQADVGILVISSRKGEFETGFEKGGQTREHAQLAKTLGVNRLVVVVNKMDDPSVKWDKARFDEIETKLTPFLKSCGFNTKKDVFFVPISGLHGYGIKKQIPKECPWYKGQTLFEVLDDMAPQDRDKDAPFRMPVLDKFRDMGTMIMGKSEVGTVRRGDSLLLMPNKAPVKVATVYRDETEVPYALPGENVRLRVTGVEEEDVSTGFVLCSAEEPSKCVTVLDCQLVVVELLEHKALFTAGYKAVLHVHTLTEEVEVTSLLAVIDPKTRKPIPNKKPAFVKQGTIVLCRIQCNQSICVERFADVPQLGRFTLRDEGRTIAIGKIMGFPQKKNKAAEGA
mmetsp:Transcript_41439/g.50222  ORF Transcript_41439/g.50222 Transcript_41439/m.50222 type:complete len:576 (+) Transcript_41439:120-1847(+)|eukprot:CAMPEP_0197850506 /NCGR_PEP_ID=MMETSP1438-20131217/15569_1 /TAXON_ID=1461541 /ORGANISM="Pterosperma sp., Strain CCMP1384" /LENGTH=575 /DNA_ID=CAMNT_0043463705 /DNA_START=113 /DNA_END=1840 /DNA_ORIENTATION=+